MSVRGRIFLAGGICKHRDVTPHAAVRTGWRRVCVDRIECQSSIGSGVWLTWVMTPLMKRASMCSGSMPHSSGNRPSAAL